MSRFGKVYISIIDRYFVKNPKLRSLVTWFIYGNRDTIVTLFGMRILINTAQENGYLRAAQKASNSSLLRDEVSSLVTLGNFIDNESVFVDIGANIGIFSIVLSRFKALYPRFEIVAFEVNPKTFCRLKSNAETYEFSAHNLGLGESEHNATFVEGAVSHVTTRSDRTNSYNIRKKEFTSKVVPLTHFIFDKKLILKIDVEGQELDVLKGARPYFDLRQVRCVFLDGYADHECWLFLESYGFRFLDGRNLRKASPDTFSLLAIKEDDMPTLPVDA